MDEVKSRIGFLLILKLAIVCANDEKVCLASAVTVKPAKCPEDRESWEKASVQKNCAAIKHNCSSFLYHCLLNPWWNETIEVCAPSILVLGGYCSEFNYGPNRILPTEHANGPSCSKFSPPCPSYYNSTEGYKYPGCFRVKQDENILITTQTPNSSEDFRSGYSTTEESQVTSRGGAQSAGAQKEVIAGVSAVIAVIIIFIIVLFIFLKRKDKVCSNGNSEENHSYRLVPQGPQVPQSNQPEQGPGTGNDPADSTTSGVTGTGDDQADGISSSVTGTEDDQADAVTAIVTDGHLQDIAKLHVSIKPAYKTEDIRQKSFSECCNFLKTKSKEFAAAGFFYKGYDYVVVCYHCGKEGDEWTENDTADDIINKHYQINQECAYIEIIRRHRETVDAKR